MAVLTQTNFLLDTRTFLFVLLSFRQHVSTSPTLYREGDGDDIAYEYRGHDFTYDAERRLVGGIVTSYEFATSGLDGPVKSVAISGIAVPAARIVAVRATPSTSDDHGLVRSLLAGNDVFNGSNANDFIYAHSGADILRGNESNDILLGELGSDSLFGGTATDVLVGGPGNDRLIAGPGLDTVFGGPGNDSFVLDAPLLRVNHDWIRDFANLSGNDDVVLLENAVMPALGAGTHPLDPAFFFAGTAAHDADDRIVYDRSTGELVYDSNGNLAGGSTLIAVFATKPLLTVADFSVM